MNIERIHYSLQAATKEISRYAATRRVTAMADLLKDEAGSHNHHPRHDEDDDPEDSNQSSVSAVIVSARLLDITA